MTDEKVNELFIQYKQTGDVAIRNQIAEKYLYIADIIAKKFAHRGVEYDDLKQVASLALLKGIERFNPELGLQFSTFITPTIAGEVKNYFRDKARMIKLPRQLSELNVKVKKFSAEYEAEHRVKPSVKVIAESLGCREEEVVEALEISGTLSLDTLVGGKEEDNDGALYSLIADTEDRYDDFERKETLKAEMSDFSEMEKRLIRYRYYDKLSQNATAEKLGVSQMYVSRLERKLLAKLKERLQGLV